LYNVVEARPLGGRGVVAVPEEQLTACRQHRGAVASRGLASYGRVTGAASTDS
jgi:hypothetical protein